MTPITRTRLSKSFSEDVGGQRRYGVRMVDRPVRSVREKLGRWPKILAQPHGPDKDADISGLREGYAPRVLLGRELDGTAHMRLHDGGGRPRIRLTVVHNGASRLEFLDAEGVVVDTLPPDSPQAPLEL